MGKPIAGRNKSPFSVDGINVFSAIDFNSNIITEDLFLIKERSNLIFDLTDKNNNILEFMKLVSVDKNNINLPIEASSLELSSLIEKGQFVIKVFDLDNGNPIGYATKFHLNKIILSSGLRIDVVDLNLQTKVPQNVDTYAINIVPSPPFELFYNAGFGINVTILKNGEPFDANPQFSSSDQNIFKIVDNSIIGTSNTGGSATLTIFEQDLYSFDFLVIARTE